MKKIKTLPAIILLTVCLLLTACNGKERTQENPDASLKAVLSYQSEQIRFDSPLDTFWDGCIVNGAAYFMGTVQEKNRQFVLIRVRADGTAEELPGYSPIRFSEDSVVIPHFCQLHSDKSGNIWAVERFIVLSDTSSSNVSYLRQFSSEGQELFRFETTELGDFQDICVDEDGKILVKSNNKVSILASDSQTQSQLDGQDIEIQKFIFLNDGRIGLLNSSQQHSSSPLYSLRTIDTKAGRWGETFEFPSTAFRAYSGDEDALFYFLDGNSLYAWRGETEEEVLSWISCGIEGSLVTDFSFMEDGRLAVLTQKGYEPEFFVLAPTDGQSEKTELTLGVIDADTSLQRLVLAFNNSSSDYYISLIDYAQGGVSRNQAANRLATEIAAGDMPDLICMDGLSARSLEPNGYLEDLWPYIDKDPELSRESLMLRPLEAAELGGKLYRISDSFSIRTVVGNKEIVGDRMSWALSDMEDAAASMPEGSSIWGHFGTKAGVLTQMLFDADRFIDWDSGTCNFESEDFKSILLYCSSFPDTVEEDAEDPFGYAAVVSGQQMLLPAVITSPHSLVEFQVLFGNQAAYVGYPNDGRQSGSMFRLSTSIAMSSSCADKAGAWSFLRTMLLPHEDTDLHTLPINREEFEQVIDLAMQPDTYEETPRSYTLSRYGDYEFSYEDRAITAEEKAQLMALYEQTNSLSGFEDAIYDIVSEQAGPYFAGDKSLDETAAAIQSRVELYLAELQ